MTLELQVILEQQVQPVTLEHQVLTVLMAQQELQVILEQQVQPVLEILEQQVQQVLQVVY